MRCGKARDARCAVQQEETRGRVREAGVASERARERQSAVCVVRSALPGHLRLGHSTRLSLRSQRAGWRGARRCPSLHPRHPYSLLSDDAGAATLHKWLQHRFGAKIASSGRKIAPSAGAEMNQIFRCPGNGFTTAVGAVSPSEAAVSPPACCPRRHYVGAHQASRD